MFRLRRPKLPFSPRFVDISLKHTKAYDRNDGNFHKSSKPKQKRTGGGPEVSYQRKIRSPDWSTRPRKPLISQMSQRNQQSVEPISENQPSTVIDDGILTGADEPRYISWLDGSHTGNPPTIHLPQLTRGLERVLFNPGVHFLRDPRTRVYNFEPGLRYITQPRDFNFDALPAFVPPSKDASLHELAQNNNARFCGSTSSVSTALSQLYMALSQFRYPNMNSVFTQEFSQMTSQFTELTRLPATVILQKQQNGVYSIDDGQKLFENPSEGNAGTIMMQQGIILENFFTREPEDYERLLSKNADQVHLLSPHPNAYAYCNYADLYLRSQLDCMHPYLPRKTFDLKTRATVAIRRNAAEYMDFINYRLYQRYGQWNSYMREYYDLTRSAFLKYSFQVRIGNMDGLFIAYHNTEEIFGFQYVSRDELDHVLFNGSRFGDQAFVLSLSLFNLCLNDAVSRFCDYEKINVTFAATPSGIDVYAEPKSDDKTKNFVQKWSINLSRMINGRYVDTLPDDLNGNDQIDLRYVVHRVDQDATDDLRVVQRNVALRLGRASSQDDQRNRDYMRKFFEKMFNNNEEDDENGTPRVLGKR